MNRALDAGGVLYLLVFVAFMLGLGVPAPTFKVGIAHAQTGKGVMAKALTITSSAFLPNGQIPLCYTCDGEDISPSLEWSELPEGTKSLALIVDDPDAPDPAAPKMTWVHWVLYNILPSATGLAEGIGPKDLPSGTKEGLNDWKALATVGLVRQSAGIVTFTSSMPWTLFCQTWGSQPKKSLKRQWRVTSFPKLS